MKGPIRVLATWDTDCVFQAHLQMGMAIRLSSDKRDSKPSVMYLGSVLQQKEYAFLPFPLHTGWNIDVMARAQAAILDHEYKNTC